MKLQQSTRNGFTIVELMIVITIIGILMAALYPAYQGYQRRAKRSRINVEMKRIQTGIDEYFNDLEEYPRTLEDLVKEPTDDRKDRWHGPYIPTKDKRAPRDAFGQPYKYNVTAEAENPYELVSYGGARGKSEPKKEWVDIWKL